MRALVAVMGLTVFYLAGCSSPKAGRFPADPAGTEITDQWKPHLLYLLPSPHARLHVEVDAVEGCEPEEATLDKLRSFLSEHCRKPDGIGIVRSDVIPVNAARGLSEKALARKFINGPDQTKTAQPGFLYVLFYNDALCSQNSGSKTGAGFPVSDREIANPYAEVRLYPAIYFNARYFPGAGGREALRHETGHILGLASRAKHAPGRHCQSGTCLMNTTLRMSRWLLGMQRGLCEECKGELEESLTKPAPTNVRYTGPVLVRSERDYTVMSLPDRVGVVVGRLADRDCPDFVRAVSAERSGLTDDSRTRVYCMVKDEVLKEPSKTREILNAFKDDVLEDVRSLGPKLFLRGCAERYKALGQYTDAVVSLREAVLLDPRDARLHNNVAWMQATCPDASARNGAEAVVAATKACELSEWKNGGFVDTLAAAYAQAGDYKRAIEFQEQAMRTGNPTNSELDGMRERLSLYKRSQPFREKVR